MRNMLDAGFKNLASSIEHIGLKVRGIRKVVNDVQSLPNKSGSINDVGCSMIRQSKKGKMKKKNQCVKK